MRRHLALASLGLAAAATLVAPQAGARERLTGEQQLAKLLEGRVAGEGRNCLTAHKMQRLQIIDGAALVYRDGKTLWVNVPHNPDQIDEDDILVTNQFGSSLCRQDVVQTYDRSGRFWTGTIFLGDFVPYRVAEAS